MADSVGYWFVNYRATLFEGGMMRSYLANGMGVNGVALHLHLLKEKWDNFEAVFVDHSGDWPETYAYLKMFQGWLKRNGHNPITVLKPDVGTVEKKRFDNIYDYYYFKRLNPIVASRMCTHRFKIDVMQKYYQKPCFNLIGFDYGESHRAKLSLHKGVENRFPLIEAEIDRKGCEGIIKDHDLPLPIKSGCYFCPFQNPYHWRELRHKHPDLICKAEQMENRYAERRRSEGKEPLWILKKPIRAAIEEDQLKLFKIDEYPPCECML